MALLESGSPPRRRSEKIQVKVPHPAGHPSTPSSPERSLRTDPHPRLNSPSSHTSVGVIDCRPSSSITLRLKKPKMHWGIVLPDRQPLSRAPFHFIFVTPFPRGFIAM